MDATSTVTTWVEQHGRQAMRAVVAGVVALLVLGAALHTAEAKPYNAGNMSKGGFIAACEGVEGTVTKKGTVIRCDLPNGTYETCNFKNTKSVVCNYTPVVAGETGPNGGLVSNVVLNGELSTVLQAQPANPGAVLTLDDDEER